MIKKGVYCVQEVVTAVSRKLSKDRHWSLHNHKSHGEPHSVLTCRGRSAPKGNNSRPDAPEEGQVQ